MSQRNAVRLRARRRELRRNRRERARGAPPSLATDNGALISRRCLVLVVVAIVVLVLAPLVGSRLAHAAARAPHQGGNILLGHVSALGVDDTGQGSDTAGATYGSGSVAPTSRPRVSPPGPGTRTVPVAGSGSVRATPDSPVPDFTVPSVDPSSEPVPDGSRSAPSELPSSSSTSPAPVVLLPPTPAGGAPRSLTPSSTSGSGSSGGRHHRSEEATDTDAAEPSAGARALSAAPGVPARLPAAEGLPVQPGATAGAAGIPRPGAVAPALGTPAVGAPTAGTPCPTANHPVRDAAGLTQALATARPGDVIQLADGRYQGDFTAAARGTAQAPITLCGGRNAVLAGGNGYTLHLDGAAHWRVAGFTIQGGQKGLMADGAQANVIEGLLIEQIGQEGLHLRAASSDNLVRGNQIQQTGRTTAEYGEGIYVGSAKKNWARFGGGGPDHSDRNVIENNTVTDTAAEPVDLKEGTTGGTLRGNTLSGGGLAGGFADSWVDVKGNGWTIADNIGSDSSADGFQVHEIEAGWGVDNRFDGNIANLGNGTGFAINVTKNPQRNAVDCDNKVTGGKGISNVPCVNAAAPVPGRVAAPA